MIMPCMVMNCRYWLGSMKEKGAGKSQLQPHQP